MNFIRKFSEEKRQNWLKVVECLLLLRKSLKPFIDKQTEDFFKELRNAGDLCPCETECCFTKGNPSKSRLCDACCKWKEMILNYHITPGGRVMWQNCQPHQWSIDKWEVAKVYMPNGHKKHKSVGDFDVAALLSLMNQCKHFSRFELGDLCAQVASVRNIVMHSPSCRLETEDFHRCLQQIKAIAAVLAKFDANFQGLSRDIDELQNLNFRLMLSEEEEVRQVLREREQKLLQIVKQLMKVLKRMKRVFCQLVQDLAEVLTALEPVEELINEISETLLQNLNFRLMLSEEEEVRQVQREREQKLLQIVKQLMKVLKRMKRVSCQLIQDLAEVLTALEPVEELINEISETLVRCLVCTQELSYSNNTSSMLRHLSARHDNTHTQQTTDPVNSGNPDMSRKQKLDEALVDMIVKDSQPFSIVDNEGFQNFVKILDPSYSLSSRKTVKAMVEARFAETKEKAIADIKQASAVSLTADMWTSVNMGTYLGVTCHYVSDHLDLATVCLGVQYFPLGHTAANIADAMANLMTEWEITEKVSGMVTDGAHNIVASVNQLQVRHIYCFAHMLNLVVKESLCQTTELENIRNRARKIVAHFKSSTKAKEKLSSAQTNMGMPQKKLIQEVETRWNSTYDMLQRLYEEREPLGAALASLATDIVPFTSDEYAAIDKCLTVLRPFYQATVELSEERRVSGSKAIPVAKMLRHAIAAERAQMAPSIGATLANHLISNLDEKFCGLEKVNSLSVATILDPRFKQAGFTNQINATAAIEKLTRECTSLIDVSAEDVPVENATTSASASNGNYNLWASLDNYVESQHRTSSAPASATVEIQRYLKEQILSRAEDPLKYWEARKTLYPTLWKLACKYLCIPASSVPCERIFSKAGELVSKKRSRLKPATVEKIIFLNKNL
uniref:E3 SUMO-protein ligase ZBED1-like isoform X1 n=1 Tax=Scatophagus argus TaxID=75038 RepID=UPI001ED823D3|nr:E3 SUMO-protein ligase ZBED1-like isoform X1 [Scatophagus argus]